MNYINIALKDLNTFRSNPRSIIPILKERIAQYNKTDDLLINRNYPMQAIYTKQGKVPVTELIQQLLEISSPLNPLQLNQSLCQLAMEISSSFSNAAYQKINIKNMKQWREKLSADKKYQFPQKLLCLVSITFNAQNESLLYLLIDDGGKQTGRKNRRIILSQDVQTVGIGFTKLNDFQSMICTVYLITKEVRQK